MNNHIGGTRSIVKQIDHTPHTPDFYSRLIWHTLIHSKTCGPQFLFIYFLLPPIKSRQMTKVLLHESPFIIFLFEILMDKICSRSELGPVVQGEW